MSGLRLGQPVRDAADPPRIGVVVGTWPNPERVVVCWTWDYAIEDDAPVARLVPDDSWTTLPCEHPAACLDATGACRWCADLAALTESYAGYSHRAETRIAALEARVAALEGALRECLDMAADGQPLRGAQQARIDALLAGVPDAR